MHMCTGAHIATKQPDPYDGHKHVPTGLTTTEASGRVGSAVHMAGKDRGDTDHGLSVSQPTHTHCLTHSYTQIHFWALPNDCGTKLPLPGNHFSGIKRQEGEKGWKAHLTELTLYLSFNFQRWLGSLTFTS